MVRIIGFQKREKEDGNLFFILELQGGVEMSLSKAGQYYATAKKAYVTSTFDEQTCKALLGTEMQGAIVKKEVEPFTYVVTQTGEELILNHRWVFVPESEQAKQEEAIDQLMADTSVFSQNGVSQLVEQAI